MHPTRIPEMKTQDLGPREAHREQDRPYLLEKEKEGLSVTTFQNNGTLEAVKGASVTTRPGNTEKSEMEHMGKR